MNSRRGRIAWILLGVALLDWLIYESLPSRPVLRQLRQIVLRQARRHGSQRDSPRGLNGWGAGESLHAPWGLSRRDRGGDSHEAVCSHQIAFLCGVLQVLFLLRRLGLPHSFIITLAIESLVMLLGFVTFIVPSVLGVQEGAKLLIFTALGLPAAAGLTVGIAFRLTSVVDNAAGLLALAALKGRKKPALVPARSLVTSD
jgi:hypothetical protein